MFSLKKKQQQDVSGCQVELVKNEAEQLYRSGRMHCAEAVLTAVKNGVRPELSDEVVKLAAGFGGGSGAGCICGAVAGGTMALGLVLPDDRKRAIRLTKELQHWFKQTYSATCCKLITSEHKGICASLTGNVAGKVAEMVRS